eukprot:92376-Amorphochlora_amoeboformis.AAC.1
MGLRFWSTVTYRFLSRVPSRPLRLGRRAMMGNIRLSRHQANWGTLEDRSSGYSRGFATQGEGPASPSDGKKEEIKGGKDAKQEVGHLRQLWDKYGWIGGSISDLNWWFSPEDSDDFAYLFACHALLFERGCGLIYTCNRYRHVCRDRCRDPGGFLRGDTVWGGRQGAPGKVVLMMYRNGICT